MVFSRARTWFPVMLALALLLVLLAGALAVGQEEKKDNTAQGQGAPAAATKAPDKPAPAGTLGTQHFGLRDAGRPVTTPNPAPSGPLAASPPPPATTPPPVWRNPAPQAPEAAHGGWQAHLGEQARPPLNGVPTAPQPPPAPVAGNQGRPQFDRPVAIPNAPPPPVATPWTPRAHTPQPLVEPGPAGSSRPWQPRARPQQDATPSGPVPSTRPRVSLPARPQPEQSPPSPARPSLRRDVTPPQERPGSVRLRVPEATFRGPQAEKRVTPRPQQPPASTPERLRKQLQTWNQPVTKIPQGGLLKRDIVGHPVPKDARFLQPAHSTHVSVGYHRVEKRLGPPTNYFSFIPRLPGDYWQGYWDGYHDGSWDGRRHHPHPAVVLNLYYGYYWSDPTWFGFYYPGYYTAVYHYYGFCPGWVYPSRVYVYPTEYVYQPAGPYRLYGGARVDGLGANRAIGEIRQAWFSNDIDLFARHLTDDLDVQVYFDGEYEYTTSTEDYYAMTADALATTQTAALDFDAPIFISSQEVFYTGRHEFYDPDGYRQVVYLSYQLRKLGTEWYVVAVGSSLNPIQHQYQDFRYR